MKLIELQTDHLTEPQQLARRHGGPRSDGVHISEVIRDIQNKVTHKGKRKPFDTLSPEERKRMGAYTSMGWAFERVIESALREVYLSGSDRFERPGELQLDGLIGTPDSLDTEEWRVGEFKATWRSSRRNLETDFVHWFWQIKAYCKMLATKEAVLYVFFVCGDYRESGPQLKCWDIWFEQKEIDENWKMLVNHAKAAGMFK